MFSRNFKAIVVLSGGQDSTTVLFDAIAKGYIVMPLTFDYGQRHRREVEAAKKVVAIARSIYDTAMTSHEIISMPDILKSSSPLLSDEELVQYNSPSELPDHNVKEIEQTFVPMRNQIFLDIAANRAAYHRASAIFTGVCQADFGGYPDCRRDFIDALEAAMNEGTFTGELGAPEPIGIHTPLMDMSKAQSVFHALRFPGCYKALAYTHTGYDGAYPPLGKDHATLLRAKGFEEAGIPDPLILRAWKEGLMHLPPTKNYADQTKVADYVRLAEL